MYFGVRYRSVDKARRHVSVASRLNLWPAGDAISCATALEQCPRRHSCCSRTAREQWHTRGLELDGALGLQAQSEVNNRGVFLRVKILGVATRMVV